MSGELLWGHTIIAFFASRKCFILLQLNKIFKEYITGDLMQIALDHVSLNLRNNEFVAILGPSGSGKTTLLNIIGGLDRYDSGDLIINGVSTSQFTDKDWDSYRNHSIGFVFQNYNLIPHQNVLSNVELALTVSGVKKEERKKRAEEALIQVGLKDHMNKLPNQLSGGQMQRVAIARALVNNPDILLADEPTGALDSETSVQIMDILRRVAKDRLVVMVTHNPELANDYATRIVTLKDGVITSDSDPFIINESNSTKTKENKFGKTSMSFLTALSLSFNNLKTKKARTFLTAFAGSIGIIGIALIISLSNGVNNYINNIQRETMTSYPITIDAQAIDLSNIIENSPVTGDEEEEVDHDTNGVYSNPFGLETASTMRSSITENNLTEFKKYLDDPSSEINNYVGENGIVYSYDTQFNVFSYDPNNVLVNTDGSTLNDNSENSERQSMRRYMTSQAGNRSGTNPSTSLSIMSGQGVDRNLEQLIPGQDEELVSKAITEQFDLVAGEWPTQKEDLVLVLNHNNEIAATTLYELGILPTEEYQNIMARIENGEELTLDTQHWNYEDLLGREYKLIPACDYYVANKSGLYTDMSEDENFLNDLLANKAVNLNIKGIIKASDEDAEQLITEPLGYTEELTNYLIEYTSSSPVVIAQQGNPAVNILSGLSFAPADDNQKVQDTITYLSGLGVSEKANMMRQILTTMGQTQMLAFMDETMLASYLDNFLQNPDSNALLQIYNTYITPGSYNDNLELFGVVSPDAPSQINIYSDSFEDKDKISEAITHYNAGVTEENQISYTDFVGLLMSSVTTIINVITWVLVAFVAVSLIVSSIMIGIITYISVLERTKEIGILRSIGASKGNISEVFNAETFIVGLISGLMGIVITWILLLPMNSIIHNLIDTNEVNAILPLYSALILIVLSIILTLIGGFIPAKKAAKKDPVTALRTE